MVVEDVDKAGKQRDKPCPLVHASSNPGPTGGFDVALALQVRQELGQPGKRAGAELWGSWGAGWGWVLGKFERAGAGCWGNWGVCFSWDSEGSVL